MYNQYREQTRVVIHYLNPINRTQTGRRIGYVCRKNTGEDGARGLDRPLVSIGEGFYPIYRGLRMPQTKQDLCPEVNVKDKRNLGICDIARLA